MNLTQYVQNHTLILDGGMGTLLQEQGLQPGELPERWSLTHPEVIRQIHRDYFDAGSSLVCANTFGANGLKFSPEELSEIVSASLRLAKEAATESTAHSEKWVALDVGPTGKMLKPYGDLDFEEAVSIFSHLMKLGQQYGADLIFIETMNDSYETKAALLAAKESTTLPVFVSNAYGADGKLMTGADAAAMVSLLEGLGADAIGVNCSLGPKALAPVVKEYLRLSSLPVIMKPNAGLPHVEDGKTVYDVSPADFAREIASLVQDGVRAVGGCCGTTPAYITALKEQCAFVKPLPLTKKNYTVVSSFSKAVFFGKNPILIGERINPTGKKRFKEALLAHDMDYILREGIVQEEKGVPILDVNVGIPAIDEPALLTEAVTELQAILATPLQIDTSDPVAMEKALRRYNGKAMINSVSGKRESMDAIFPLAKKYGGLVVALTLDESGIPETAEGRVAIAEKILAEANKWGLDKKDLIFDPLTLTVSADSKAPAETLRAVEMLTQMGCHTSLGVSNVSFGLPQRDWINSTFFALALSKGLSAAIMNPHSTEMLKTYYAYRALTGRDENCGDYIAYASACPVPASAQATVAAPHAQSENASSPLQNAIIKGLKESATQLTAQLIQEEDPLALVQEEIIPALDLVGRGFEKKRVYLPSLLMSAEAAKAAFEVVKEAMKEEGGGKKCPFVLATVKGDIHDIGKNIVKLLLENYGFAVHDLGRDVPPERIIEEVVQFHAPLCGLSALMTTTVPAMEETIALLRREAPTCKIIVGGAVLTEEYARSIGADHYGRDAMEAVRYAEEVFASLGE